MFSPGIKPMNVDSSEKGEMIVAAATGNLGSARHPGPRYQLPETPLVVIEPSKAWVNLDLKNVWVYRELLYFLTWRDVKIRYKQTALGVLWAVLQPLLMMIVFSLFF